MAHSTRTTATTLTTVQVPTTIGLDLSDRESHFHVMRGDGQTLATGKVETKRGPLSKLFASWKGCRLILEAGGHSPWVSRLSEQCELETVVANPRRVELISKSDRKTDRHDAQTLAELGLGRLTLLAPITHRSESAQADLSVRDARNAAVKVRTGMINFVRGKLKSSGYRAAKCTPENFHSRAVPVMPAQLELALRPMLTLIGHVNLEIRKLDKQIEQLCKERYPITHSLRQVPGVGAIVSYSFVLTIDDPKRFKPRQVGTYLGLVSRKKSSGDKDPQMSITKAGDREMRRLLVLSANYILGRFGPDCDLRRFGLKIAGDGSKRNKKRAKVAVARKLAILLHHLWVSGEAYDPLYQAKKRGEVAA